MYCPVCNHDMLLVVDKVFRCEWCRTVVNNGKTVFVGEIKKNPIALDYTCLSNQKNECNGITKIRYDAASLTYVKHMDESHFLDKKNENKLLSYIDNIVFKESPIDEDRLRDKLFWALDINDTHTIRSKFSELLVKAEYNTTYSVTGKLIIWSKCQEPDSYHQFRDCRNTGEHRSLENLSKEEICNALLFSYESRIDKLELIKRSAYLMGFDILTVEMGEAFRQLLDDLLITIHKMS